MVWDRILSSTPLNREAATVTSGGWENGLRKAKADTYERDGPHPTKKPPNDPSFEDRTGQRFGKFTVLGLVADDPASANARVKSGSLWSVKCDCGTYTARRSKALRKYKGRAPFGPCCVHCERSWEVANGIATINIHTGQVDQP